MKIRFGVAPIAWTNSDLPQLGGNTTLETCLTESQEAGFSGTETGVKFPMETDPLQAILQRYGLKLVSGWFSGELLARSVDEEKARIESQLATFQALGAPVLVYAETTGSVQSKTDVPVSNGPACPMMNSALTAASSRRSPSISKIAGCPWPITIIWAPSWRASARSMC